MESCRLERTELCEELLDVSLADPDLQVGYDQLAGVLAGGGAHLHPPRLASRPEIRVGMRSKTRPDSATWIFWGTRHSWRVSFLLRRVWFGSWNWNKNLVIWHLWQWCYLDLDLNFPTLPKLFPWAGAILPRLLDLEWVLGPPFSLSRLLPAPPPLMHPVAPVLDVPAFLFDLIISSRLMSSLSPVISDIDTLQKESLQNCWKMVECA